MVARGGRGSGQLGGLQVCFETVIDFPDPCPWHPLAGTTHAQVDETDRVVFKIRDTGLLAESHLGGLLGPQIIANTSVAVGENFQGFLELQPSKVSGVPEFGSFEWGGASHQDDSQRETD